MVSINHSFLTIMIDKDVFQFFLLVVLLVSVVPVFAGEPWVELFDGKTLNGWEQKGGKAKYSVKDGQIIGQTVLGTPNSFLCTKQFYSDFILEVEFKVDSQLNSGIQIRSNSVPEYSFLYWRIRSQHRFLTPVRAPSRCAAGDLNGPVTACATRS